MTEKTGYRFLLGWVFFLEVAFMLGNWPAEPPPELPSPEQSYDLSLLLDPPPPTVPETCPPMKVMLGTCPILVLR